MTLLKFCSYIFGDIKVSLTMKRSACEELPMTYTSKFQLRLDGCAYYGVWREEVLVYFSKVKKEQRKHAS